MKPYRVPLKWVLPVLVLAAGVTVLTLTQGAGISHGVTRPAPSAAVPYRMPPFRPTVTPGYPSPIANRPPVLPATRTPLPTLPPYRIDGYRAENLVLSFEKSGPPDLLPALNWFASWSPDGAKVAIARHGLLEGGLPDFVDSVVAVLDVATGVWTDIAPGYAPSWSPGGHYIAFLQFETGDIQKSGFTIHVYDTRTGELRLLPTRDDWRWQPHIVWLSTIDLLAIEERPVIHNIANGQRTELREPTLALRTPADLPPQRPISDPSSGTFAITQDNTVYVYRWRDGSATLTGQRRGVVSDGWVMAPGGETIASPHRWGPPGIEVFNMAAPADPVLILPGGPGFPHSGAWTADGQALVFAFGDTAFVVNRDGSGLRDLLLPARTISGLRISPAGDRLVTRNADGRLEFWRIAVRP